MNVGTKSLYGNFVFYHNIQRLFSNTYFCEVISFLMDLEMGAVVAGKVTGITKFGAFVSIAPGVSGLVHISEIASSYVSDVRDHLTEGQEIIVKIIGADKSDRMNLSIKAAAENVDEAKIQPPPKPPVVASEPSFEDKLKRFMQDSNSKISGLKRSSNKKGTRRRGR